MLGERTDADGADRVPPGEALRMRRFQVIWGLLDFMTQRRLLPEVVERVEFSESDSRLSVSLSKEGMAHVIKNPQQLQLSGKKHAKPGRC